MQYRYGAKPLERSQFDAVKAKLLYSRGIDSCRNNLPGETRQYAGRFTEFAGRISFFAAGQPLETASIPLHAGSVGLTNEPSGVQSACMPDSIEVAAGSPIPGSDAAPHGDNARPEIPEDSGLRPAAEHFSTAVLGGVLSVTVAMLAGLIIAQTSAFNVDVAPDVHAAAEGIAATPLTMTPADVAPAQPARAIQAPPAPALSVSKDESQRTARSPSLAKSTAQRKSTLSGKKATSTRIAKQREAPKSVRTARRTAPVPLVRNERKQPEPALQASAAPNVHGSRPAVPSLGAQYARCTQQQGLLRRERCKWDVCGGKWGKQGCPSYKYRVTPAEMGLGHLSPVDAGSRREGS